MTAKLAPRNFLVSLITAYVVGFLPLVITPWVFEDAVTRCGAGMAGSAGGTIVGATALAAVIGALIPSGRHRLLGFAGVALVAGGSLVAAFDRSCGAGGLVGEVLVGLGCGTGYAVGLAIAGQTEDPTRSFGRLWIAFVLWQAVLLFVGPYLIPATPLGLWLIPLLLVPFYLAGCIFLVPAEKIERRPAELSDTPRSAFAPATLLLIGGSVFLYMRDGTSWALTAHFAEKAGLSPERYGLLAGIASLLALLGPLALERLTTGRARRWGAMFGVLAGFALSVSFVTLHSPLSFTLTILPYSGIGLAAVTLLMGWISETDTSGRAVGLAGGLSIALHAVGTASAGYAEATGGPTAPLLLVLTYGTLDVICVAAAVLFVRAGPRAAVGQSA
ncbi:MAG: hypothetical protein P0Y56_15325 [Candidatus Andeanibacterium colombiense]|uniref:MFS transporter n=1 Tax=Candidatus Andeanibacterium colombiense TaxID=3121345 RepID=A0AAJ5X2C5_9SPHN|nr:MAG: hypothetical protein P0Y56_15325 [Sphingomonadaceae bacterium]